MCVIQKQFRFFVAYGNYKRLSHPTAGAHSLAPAVSRPEGAFVIQERA